jgi:hypothetical protein
MGTLPRPLLAVLLAVIVAAAAWLVVFKPASSSVSTPSPAVVESAVAQGAAHATPKKTAAPTAHPATRPAAHRSAKPHPAKTAAHPVLTPRTRMAEVDAALADDQVLAVLFYNPAAADDQAAAGEVAAIPSHHGQVVRVAVPISELSSYTPITAHVQVTGSPTLVVVNRKHDARTLVGYADQLEYDQLVVAALAAK